MDTASSAASLSVFGAPIVVIVPFRDKVGTLIDDKGPFVIEGCEVRSSGYGVVVATCHQLCAPLLVHVAEAVQTWSRRGHSREQPGTADAAPRPNRVQDAQRGAVRDDHIGSRWQIKDVYGAIRGVLILDAQPSEPGLDGVKGLA